MQGALIILVVEIFVKQVIVGADVKDAVVDVVISVLTIGAADGGVKVG